MAAYAALLSLMHTINDLKNHPKPPITLHPKHLLSLTQTLAFLQDFLERYSNEEDEDLERRITAAAHAAEDVIETHIVDVIEAGSFNHNISSSGDFYGDLERAIQDLDLIKREAMEISEAMNKRSQHHHTHSSPTPAAPTWQSSSTMVDFDDVFVIKVLDKLVGQQSNLQIIPIVGMGGIGKTTFARNIYSKPIIVEHFDFLAWVVISQECSGLKILSQVLGQENRGVDDELDKLGVRVYQRIWYRRYLIVMDDIWSSEPWNEVKTFFPDNNNGSRIMITTRKSNLAFELSGSQGFYMNFLNEDKSWDLFCLTVFGEESSCPAELKETGKAIARKCRGLPLSVIVIGGVLRKPNMTWGYWEYTLKNLNSLINLEEDEYCLQLLRTSYKELSVHLKPCFLYMGIFPEDRKIKVSDVIKMWVAEGIVKPIDERSLEEAAEEYLRELIDRNLIIVVELGWNGKVDCIKIHDVLRDVCIREAKRQRFYCVVNEEVEIPDSINMERRICLHMGEEYRPKTLAALRSAPPVARSLIFIDGEISLDDIKESVISRVLRFGYDFGGWRHWDHGFLKLKRDDFILQWLNLRCISLVDSTSFECLLFLWNLQSLGIDDNQHLTIKNSEWLPIWKMPLLRHAELHGRLTLSDPVGQDNFVLEHLHTLSCLVNFTCDEEVVKRIPNIHTLRLDYDSHDEYEDEEQINLLHLNNLHNLQTLYIRVYSSAVLRVAFPHSLERLSLWGTELDVEELNTSIASLPLLQFLRIGFRSFRGSSWETGEAQFCTLTYLEIEYWDDLKFWIADDTSFPCLQYLNLSRLQKLEEIPSSIGDIPTLQTIRVNGCSESAKESAKRIKEEQEGYGNEHLQISII